MALDPASSPRCAPHRRSPSLVLVSVASSVKRAQEKPTWRGWYGVYVRGGPEATVTFLLLPFLLSLCFLLGSLTGMVGMVLQMGGVPFQAEHPQGTPRPHPSTGQNRALTSGICCLPPFPLHENAPCPTRPAHTCHPCLMSWLILTTVPSTPLGTYRPLWFPARTVLQVVPFVPGMSH